MKTYTFLEAAKVMNTSETTLNELLVTGEVPACKIGMEWCIPEESADAYIRAEVERQTRERIEARQLGQKPKVKTARGNLRTFKPDLDKMAA